MLAKAFKNTRQQLLFSSSQRSFATKKAELKPLPWEMNALEPVLSGHLIETHYTKHH